MVRGKSCVFCVRETNTSRTITVLCLSFTSQLYIKDQACIGKETCLYIPFSSPCRKQGHSGDAVLMHRQYPVCNPFSHSSNPCNLSNQCIVSTSNDLPKIKDLNALIPPCVQPINCFVHCFFADNRQGISCPCFLFNQYVQ